MNLRNSSGPDIQAVTKYIADMLASASAPSEHAFLSPSKYTWLEWDDETLKDRFISSYATTIGTLVHDFAAKRITKRKSLKSGDRGVLEWMLIEHDIPESMIDLEYLFGNLKQYVNDAIHLGMDAEQKISYSRHCFGTADAILYSPPQRLLRIHDLKTGTTPAHMEQLIVYAALYTLVKKLKPEDIQTELRIYQAGEIVYYKPTADDLYRVRGIIVHHDRMLNQMLGMKVNDEEDILYV